MAKVKNTYLKRIQLGEQPYNEIQTLEGSVVTLLLYRFDDQLTETFLQVSGDCFALGDERAELIELEAVHSVKYECYPTMLISYSGDNALAQFIKIGESHATI
jgi:hypothetical protein